MNPEPMSILIRNGWVVDGTGNPAQLTDVLIEKDRIADLGSLPGARAETTIDASGRIVCPGLIDCHSHTDWTLFSNPDRQSTIRQGVTTEIVGNCGFSLAPLSDLSRDQCQGLLRQFAYEGPAAWTSFADYLQAISRMGTAANLAHFVGHSAIRAAAGLVVSTRAATSEQMQTMQASVQEALEAGALGLSTGLEYDPGRLASTAEIMALTTIVGRQGGVYASHIRNYDADILPAVDEFVSIVRQSKVRGQLSHLNVRDNTGAPEGAWHRAVDRLIQARDSGLDIQTDCVGFGDGIGKLASILPPWVLAHGPEQASQQMRDPQVRSRLRGECDRYWRFLHRGDWHRVRLVQDSPFPDIAGKHFDEIAALWGKDPWDCYFDIMAAAGSGLDDLIAVGLLFSEAHVAEMVAHPLFALESDIVSSDLESPLREKLPFKASYAGMIHFLTQHVRRNKTLRLEEAIRKMTSMPAAHFGLQDRGVIRKGAFADVVVFDYQNLEDGATDEQPLAYARGVEEVIVNGRPVIRDAKPTGARPGRNLLRDPG